MTPVFSVSLRLIVLFGLVSALSACMVGPNFHSPAMPRTTSYTNPPVPAKTVGSPMAGKAGRQQYFVYGQDIPAQWWILFHSSELNWLIEMGLTHSPTLAAAQATLRQAQETMNAQIGALMYPAVAAQLSAERQRFASSTFGGSAPASTFNLFNAAVNVSYTLDIFGGSRRQIEALAAQVDYQQYQLQGAYLTLTANIVTTAITMASIRAQLAATQQLIASQQQQLRIVKQQYHLGGVSWADVLSQDSQVAQLTATLPPLEQSLAQAEHALAVYVGALPSNSQLPQFNLEQLQLPTQLPLSLPSLLVRQRPDIRASEALLHVASAQVGIATANLFPQFNITGSYGMQVNRISDPLTPSNVVWNLMGNIAQPIFNGGELQAQRRAAIAAFDAALAQYRQTVLQAFQNVADTLRALENDAKNLQAQGLNEAAAASSLKLIVQQFRLGGVNYLSLLNAQRQYQQARIGRIQAQASRYADTAALFHALGGGWWQGNRIVTIQHNSLKSHI